MDSEQTTRLIRHRRSVKPALMSDQTIDPEIIREILENACWAPTHGMTQPWRFVVFTGQARNRLANVLAETYKAITPGPSFKPQKYEKLSVNPIRAGAVIGVGMKRQESEKISELDELLAIGCAVQNLHLSATSHGLGGFWSTNNAAVSDTMRDFYGLSDRDRALGLFYLGYPNSDWPDSVRDPLESKVDWQSE